MISKCWAAAAVHYFTESYEEKYPNMHSAHWPKNNLNTGIRLKETQSQMKNVYNCKKNPDIYRCIRSIYDNFRFCMLIFRYFFEKVDNQFSWCHWHRWINYDTAETVYSSVMVVTFKPVYRHWLAVNWHLQGPDDISANLIDIQSGCVSGPAITQSSCGGGH